MNTKELEAFKYEIRNWNNIPLGSINCGVNCIFCKINSDPILRRFPPIPAITIEDLYAGFNEIDLNYPFVRLGAGVLVAPHTDPFVHSDIYDFIQHTADYFSNNTVTTVTTGSHIKLSKLDDLNRISNYGIALSLVTMQPSRETLIPYSTRDKINILLKDAPITKISLMFTGNLNDLYKDLELLYNLGLNNQCDEILVRRIEYVDSSPKVLKKIAVSSILEYCNAVKMLKNEFPSVIYTIPCLDDKYFKDGYHYFIDANTAIANLRRELVTNNDTKYLIVTPMSSYHYFNQELSKIQNANIVAVPNITYGGSITVSGLLTNQDLYSALDPLDPSDVSIIVPKEMYDKDYFDLTGHSSTDISERYNSRLLLF